MLTFGLDGAGWASRILESVTSDERQTHASGETGLELHGRRWPSGHANGAQAAVAHGLGKRTSGKQRADCERRQGVPDTARGKASTRPQDAKTMTPRSAAIPPIGRPYELRSPPFPLQERLRLLLAPCTLLRAYCPVERPPGPGIRFPSWHHPGSPHS